ncbi:glycosyltransferase family 4 protein [Tractidigestivibacter montrealensis]|uniref:Glycosyltransferase family 4 protein n=1 Tax=Tractidigestivibacter montrealensis TaxID=2972466 RepID=A0ABT1Z925_9ACTN|nr:glycosyltransferase family 4 protein [Tractidigestivibacter montrealensis]
METFTANLAHQLVLGGDGVCVVTSARDDAPEVETQEDGVRIVRLPSMQLMGGRLPLSRHGSRERSLLSAVSGLGVDRVLVNTRFYGTSVTGLRFARDIHVPAVLLDHGSAWLTFGRGEALDAAAHAWERRMTAKDVSLGATFAGISEKSAAWLATFGIKTSLVIPNAIDGAAFRGESSGRDFRFELGIPEDKTLVAFVGRLAPEKGPERLLAAMELLGERCACVLAGEGTLRPQLERGLPANAHLVGNLGHADLSALLSQADVFCLPTRSEGFCTSLLEAGAWGVPCVVPDVGGAREVLCHDGKTFGLIAPDREPATMADGIRQVVAAWTSEQARELRAHVERDLSWPQTVRALERAYMSSRIG